MVSPRALAVRRLMTSSNFRDSFTGRSGVLALLRKHRGRPFPAIPALLSVDCCQSPFFAHLSANIGRRYRCFNALSRL